MIAAPHMTTPPADTAPTTTQRPKRIHPPAHWQQRAQPAAPAKPTVAATPITPTTTAQAMAPRISARCFGLLLGVAIVVLNVMLFWLVPLPAELTRTSTPKLVGTETADQPSWLRP